LWKKFILFFFAKRHEFIISQFMSNENLKPQ
jgi:hypothetical protein